jgi:hypothetical protein
MTPYLPASLTQDDLELCTRLAEQIRSSIRGRGGRPDRTRLRDLLLAVIVKSCRADEFEITQDQLLQFLGWAPPDAEHHHKKLRRGREDLRDVYLKHTTVYGLLSCIEVGVWGESGSTYAIHWSRWDVSGDDG